MITKERLQELLDDYRRTYSHIAAVWNGHDFTRPETYIGGHGYASGGPPPKDKPKALAHARAVAVLGPKRGRWK